MFSIRRLAHKLPRSSRKPPLGGLVRLFSFNFDHEREYKREGADFLDDLVDMGQRRKRRNGGFGIDREGPDRERPDREGFGRRRRGGGGERGGGGGRGMGRGWDGGFDRFRERPQRAAYDEKEAVPDIDDEELFSKKSAEGIDYTKYEEIEVKVEGNTVQPVENFSDLNLHPKVKANVEMYGYKDPTPIQKYSIPNSLEERDIMACVCSGKTAAFLLPIMHRILNSTKFGRKKSRGYGDPIKPLALVITPTRELCRQIHEESRKFSFRTGIKSCTAYGGQPRDAQLRQMSRGCEVLIATPGRLNDFLENRNVSLADIEYLAIDEADRMMDMGFLPQIDRIVEHSDMSRSRQTMVFSATFPKEIQSMAARYLNEYVFITVGRVGSTTDLITQKIVYVQDFNKMDALRDFVQNIDLGIVFCKTKVMVDRLESNLDREMRVSSIHGNKSQSQRDRALFNFKKGFSKLLIATDVAARGLDIPNVTHVINYDTPNNIDEYVHRIGRTGRAGKKGTAISFVNEENGPVVSDLIKLLKESKQDVPEELSKLESFGGGGYGVSKPRRGGSGGRFRTSNSYERNDGGRGGYERNKFDDDFEW
ncbi:hypothetical protein AAMO2058_001094500 [Amorphochlora amoebiformis]